MAVLLVTYDLNRPGQEYKDFYETLETFSPMKLSESSYAINTLLTPNDIYRKFKDLLDKNDFFYVIHLFKPIAGQGNEGVNSWLEANLLSYHY